jgi:hypothetical protein
MFSFDENKQSTVVARFIGSIQLFKTHMNGWKHELSLKFQLERVELEATQVDIKSLCKAATSLFSCWPQVISSFPEYTVKTQVSLY